MRICVGKSQILNVPVAEAAKTLVGSISKSDIIGEWKETSMGGGYLSIKEDGSFYYRVMGYKNDKEYIAGYNEGYYKINGDLIYFFSTNKCGVFFANYDNKNIFAKSFAYFDPCNEDEGLCFIIPYVIVFEK